MMRSIARTALLLLPLLAGTAPLRAQTPSGEALPVAECVLPNGLRFLVLRREGAPTVSFVTQYRVGSVQERAGETGIAHLLEHMLFKGTTTIGTRDLAAELALFPVIDAVQDTIRSLSAAPAPADTAHLTALEARLKALEDSARTYVMPNDFDRILTQNGARGLNATTTYESTTYHVELPSNRARLWFILEADRLLNPVFREFYAERSVVAEERRMRIESDPGGLLWERFLATAYHEHPYGVPVVGRMEDIERYSRRQAESYFRRYYAPNNAVVAVVGDVIPDSVFAWAERYLAPLPRGEDAAPVRAREPEQQEERRVDVTFDAEPRLLMGWHTPEPAHPDHAALTVLAAVLTGGNTSRLQRKLVLEERLATSASALLEPGARDPLLFTIGAAPRAPHTTAELERAIEAELERLKEEPPTAAELERIRNQLEAANVRRLRSNLGLAFQLAESSTFHGDWRTTFRLTRRLQEVTPEDVQRVARRYFTLANRTVATLVRGKPSERKETP